MFCLFKVVTRGCVLNQSAIQIISLCLCFPKMPQYGSENLMVTTLKRFIVYLLKERRVFREDAQGFSVIGRYAFHYR